MVKCYRIVILSAILSSLVSLNIRAQYDMSFAHYFDMPTSFNPAAVGKEAKINVNAAYAMNLVGFEGAPHTMYFSGDMPFQVGESRLGLGLMLINDQLGLFTHQRIEGQLAFRSKVRGGWFAGGAQIGLISEDFKASDLDLEDEVEDYAFPSGDDKGTGLDISFGLYYNKACTSHPGNSWFAGLSAQHLTSPTITLGDYAEMKINAAYYLTGGYTFQLRNPTLSVATAALVKTDQTTYRGDVSSRLIYRYDGREMYAGLGYSPTNSFTVYIGGMFHGVMLGYSYEAYTNGLSFGNGSHEISVGYQTDINLGKKGRNKHQSVRYL